MSTRRGIALTDQPTYMTVHWRLHAYRGPAKHHDCTACGEQAHTWAYTHNGRPELYARDHNRTPYSPDLTAYAPMCFTCHRAYDRGRLTHPALNDVFSTAVWCEHTEPCSLNPRGVGEPEPEARALRQG